MIDHKQMRYVHGISRKPLPEGRVRVHNHVITQPRIGMNGAARLCFDTVADLAPFTTPIHVSAQGMLTWKLVPPPTVLSTQMRPLWASTIPLQIANPSPALARDA